METSGLWPMLHWERQGISQSKSLEVVEGSVKISGVSLYFQFPGNYLPPFFPSCSSRDVLNRVASHRDNGIQNSNIGHFRRGRVRTTILDRIRGPEVGLRLRESGQRITLAAASHIWCR